MLSERTLSEHAADPEDLQRHADLVEARRSVWSAMSFLEGATDDGVLQLRRSLGQLRAIARDLDEAVYAASLIAQGRQLARYFPNESEPVSPPLTPKQVIALVKIAEFRERR